MSLIKNLMRCRKGAAMVEYALLIGGVALIGAAAIATFGHKVNDMIGLTATILPGAHADDNQPIVSGKIIETTDQANGEDSTGAATTGIGLSFSDIATNSGTQRLGNRMGLATGDSVADLVLEAP